VPRHLRDDPQPLRRIDAKPDRRDPTGGPLNDRCDDREGNNSDPER
jgi:hypothetical protein